MIQTLKEFGDLQKVQELQRKGDDLYWQEGKLNVSIATSCHRSFLIHFGVNVSNAGTPVKTSALEDFAVQDPQKFSVNFMKKVVAEVESQIRATKKVRVF